MKNIKKGLIALFVISSFIGLTFYAGSQQNPPGYFFELDFKTNGGGFRPDYGYFVAQQLKEIGIKVNVKTMEWNQFVGTILETYDFDLCTVSFFGGGLSPDPGSVYSETASLNMFGIDTTIPYGQQNEDLLNQGSEIMNLTARQQHYYDWQELIIDKILPSVPLFAPKKYNANWANLNGYNNSWGIADSLPYMIFDGFHEGQISTTELNIHELSSWQDLNPLTQNTPYDEFITSLITESLLKIDPGTNVTKTGLIVDWAQDSTNPYIFNFTLRDNVYWNPSFNITGRTGASDPLFNQYDDPDPNYIINGLKGENSTGINQKVTAKDAVFTLLALANDYVSNNAYNYEWIKDIWIDSVDNQTFWIEVDADTSTPENEGYVDIWADLTTNLLPEFFLNSTDTTITYSSGDVPMIGLYNGISETSEWKTYKTSAFGCGKYVLDYSIENSITVMQKSPFWHGIGAIDGTVQDLDIETINVRVIPDSETALNEFQVGKLDLLEITEFPEERKEMQTDPAFEIQFSLADYLTFVGFNLRRPFIGGADNSVFLTEPGYEAYTKALAVRKAIAYAINRTEINEEIHSGEFVITDSYIYRVQDYWYYHDITKYTVDLSTAWMWMELAGYLQVNLEEDITLYEGEETITDTTTETETVDTTITETETVSDKITITTNVTENNTKSVTWLPFGFTFVIFLIGLIPVYRRRKANTK